MTSFQVKDYSMVSTPAGGMSGLGFTWLLAQWSININNGTFCELPSLQITMHDTYAMGLCTNIYISTLTKSIHEAMCIHKFGNFSVFLFCSLPIHCYAIHKYR